MKAFVTVLFFFAFLALFPASANASAQVQTPANMAAVGDSMTAGVLTPYKRTEALLPWHHLRILWNSLQLLATGERESLAFRQFSWSTGNKLASHAQKIKLHNPELVAQNFAQPTANSAEVLKKQIPALLKWSNEILHQPVPDYVTFLIGHNDLCGYTTDEITSVANFRRNIHESFKLLLGGQSRARVLVAPMARIDTLPEVVGKSFVLPIKGLHRCENMWKTIPLCRTVTQRDSKEAQEFVRQRLFDFNDVLINEVREMRSRYGDRIRLAKEMLTYVPQPKDVAIDCFHANKDAQAKISEMTWNASWWN